MSKLVRVLSLSAVLSLLATTSSWAAPFTLTAGGAAAIVVYNGTSLGCAACQVVARFSLSATGLFTVQFENTSTDGQAGVNILTGLGFDSTPTLPTSPWNINIENGLSWTAGNGTGLGNYEIIASANNGVNNGLDNQNNIGDGGSVSFQTNPALATIQIDDTQVHIQALVGGASIKPTGSVCTTCPTPTPFDTGEVPEPATLLLLGTGLFGVARMRRRGQQQ